MFYHMLHEFVWKSQNIQNDVAKGSWYLILYIRTPTKSGRSLMISLQHHAQNFIPIRNLSLGQTFNNPFFFFFFESLTYIVVHLGILHWKCDLKWLLLDFWKILVTYLVTHSHTQKLHGKHNLKLFS